MATKMAKQREDIEAARENDEPPPNDDPALIRLAEIVASEGANASLWGDRLNEASAEIDLLASRPVGQAARAHYQIYADVLDLIERNVDESMPWEELRHIWCGSTRATLRPGTAPEVCGSTSAE